MAQKYKSSLKQKGFSPEQISDAGVNRILQEGNRQVNVLKEQFAYEKSQRDKVLATMKENAALEQQDRQKNFNLETQNRKDIQQRKQDNFKIQQQNETNQAEAQAKLYSQLSKLSMTAATKVQELQQERFDRDYEDQMIKIMMGEVDVFKQAEFQDTEAQLLISSAENDVGASALEAAGASPLQAQRVRSNSKGRQYANDKALAILAMQEFMPYAERVLKGMPEVVDPVEKREVMLSLLKPYMQEKGLYGLNPQFLTEPLQAARKGIGEYFRKEDEAFTKNQQVLASEQSLTAFLGDPNNLVANAAQLLRDKTVEFDGDRSKALKYIIDTAGANMSDEEWEAFSNMTFPDKTRPVKDDFPARWKTANDARIEARRKKYNDNEKDNAIELQQLERKLLPLLDNANEATVREILAAYQNSPFNPSKVSSEVLRNRANQVSYEAQNFKGSLEAKIQMAQLGLYTEEDLAQETDPAFAEDKTLSLLAKKNSAWRNAAPVQERAKALRDFVGQARGRYNAESNEYNFTQNDLTAIYRAESEFYQRVQQLMADPTNPRTADQAAQEAGQMIQDKIERLNRLNPDEIAAPGDRVYSGSYEPKISTGATATKKWLTESVDSLKNQNKLVALRTKPGLILDKPRLDAIEQSWNTSGFTYPKDLIMLSDAIGLSPSQIINAQREAMKMPPLPERPQDALLNTVPAEIRQQILRATSSNQSIRALSVTGTGFNSAAVPRNLGPAIAEAANKYGIPPAILAGLISTESKFQGGQNVKSEAGAVGIAQIIPKWHPTHTPGLSDVEDIRYAASYLAKLRDEYFGGDLERAIYAYNAGPYGGVGLTKENREYLPNVLKEAARFGFQEAWRNPQSMRPGMSPKIMAVTDGVRSFTGALTYLDNQEEYLYVGKQLESLGFRVGEHSQFGGTAPVHAGNSYHNYDEAFDVTHWQGTRLNSIEKTRQLKEAIRSLGLFKEIIGPGDGDPNHESHLHLGGLLRPMTEADQARLQQLMN